MKRQTVQIGSSHGTIVADKETGKILSKNIDSDVLRLTEGEECWWRNAVSVDVSEWKKFWRKEVTEYIDILDIGVTMEDGTHTPADDAFRKDVLTDFFENGGVIIR